MINLKFFVLEHKKIFLTIGALFILMLAAVGYLIATHRVVTVVCGERTEVSVYGLATNATVLHKAGIILEPYDQVSVPLEESADEGQSIVVYKDAILPEPEEPEEIPSEKETETEIKQTANMIETPTGTFAYTKQLTAEATAYCPESCYPYDGIHTADGSTAKEYHTIAASREIPFGTKVYIPYFKDQSNGGIFEVEDRGGAIKGDIIDIFFDTYDEAIRFGRRNVTIYILE